MTEFIPGQIYNNLIKLCKYRNSVINTEILEPGTVVQRLNHYEYLTITAVRPGNDERGRALCVIVLIAPDSKYSTKSGDFKKLLKSLPVDDNLEVLFVSPEPLTVHIKKYLGKHRQENPKVFIEDYDYTPFLIVCPEHISVPPHFIATAEEIAAFCKRWYKQKEQFPKILQSDPQAIWLGLRPGQCARIHRPSENAGIAIVYRICIK